MAGPCSLPNGSKADWEEMNEIVCTIHFHCDMDVNRVHDFVTYRMWLASRKKLRTGKTK